MVFTVSFAICAAAIKLSAPIAQALGLVDKPDVGRKLHSGDTPLTGGIALYLTVLIVTGIFGKIGDSWLFFTCAFSILFVGFIDDLHPIQPKIRILFQIAVGLIVVYAGGIQIYHVGNLVGAGNVYLGPIAVIFTVACMIGVINSINMVDGMDGLAGSIVCITIAAVSILSLSASQQTSIILISLLGALVSFLFFNTSFFRPNALLFMGDAGSNFLGFVLVWFFIYFTQSDKPVFSAVVAGWLFGLPLMDTISVMVKRLRQSKSPFSPGRDHFHHDLLAAGLSKTQTLFLMAAIHGTFVLIGMIFHDRVEAQPYLFWLFVFIVVIHHFATPKFLHLLKTRKPKMIT